MSVRPEARGRGIASALTETLLEQAKALGCRRVVLHSSDMAVGVYVRLGFVHAHGLRHGSALVGQAVVAHIRSIT